MSPQMSLYSKMSDSCLDEPQEKSASWPKGLEKEREKKEKGTLFAS